MPQFDVCRNPGRQRDAVPYLVVLQSDRFDRAPPRFVAPLVSRNSLPTVAHCLAPRFTGDRKEVIPDVFNLATIFADRLGPPIASLADADSRAKLIGAIDALISQA